MATTQATTATAGRSHAFGDGTGALTVLTPRSSDGGSTEKNDLRLTGQRLDVAHLSEGIVLTASTLWLNVCILALETDVVSGPDRRLLWKACVRVK